MLSRLHRLDEAEAADINDGLALGNQLVRDFSVQIINSAVCLVSLMVKTSSQFGRPRICNRIRTIAGLHGTLMHKKREN